jgi:hypothetical protein
MEGGNTCMFPGCLTGRYSRGMCNKHYANIRRQVLQNKFTWDELEKRGKVLPARRRGADYETVRKTLDYLNS